MSSQLLTPIILLLAATVLPIALALFVYRRTSGHGEILLVLLLLAMSEWALA